MYANLAVTIDSLTPFAEHVYASAVELRGRRAVIVLDANDGESDYAIPNGKRVVDLDRHTLDIAADF
jgi:hypothetical protein